MLQPLEFLPSTLTEISGAPGSGKTEVVLSFLARKPSTRAAGATWIAWIEEELTLYPVSFLQHQIPLERVIFIEAKESRAALWAALQVLRSQVFQTLVLSADIHAELDLRRLQLAAEKSCASVILLRESALVEGTWPITAQFEVSRSFSEDGSPTLIPIKYKGQRKWKTKEPVSFASY